MEIATPLLAGVAAVVGLLVVGAGVSVFVPSIRARVKTWVVIAGLIVVALVAGRVATIVLFACVSFIALREFLSLVPTRREDRAALLVAYALVPVSYLLIGLDRYGIWLVTVPVFAFLLMPAVLVLNGRTSGYLAAAGIINWGLVVTVHNLGYVAHFMNVPASEAPAGGAGLLFFLLVATGLNDVFQYVAGRSIGGPKIVPSVSPNKTWSGFIGGVVGTAVLVMAIGPLFTALPTGPLALLAVLLPVAGIAGDVTMSAVKRDLGVKDSGKLLPGHGGAIDRLDSLTFTAPITFHLVAYVASERF